MELNEDLRSLKNFTNVKRCTPFSIDDLLPLPCNQTSDSWNGSSPVSTTSCRSVSPYGTSSESDVSSETDSLGRYSPPELPPAQGSQKRKGRKMFTDCQVLELEKTFERKPYLDSNERRELSIKIGMTETQVKTWFQNRRMKKKRKRTEETQYYTKLAFANRVTSGGPPQRIHGYEPHMYPTILPHPNMETPRHLLEFHPFATPGFRPGTEFEFQGSRFGYPPFYRECPGSDCPAVPLYSNPQVVMATSTQNKMNRCKY